MAEPQSAQLREYVQQFEALKQEAGVLVNGLSAEAFNWRYHPESWSVGECLDHLNTTGALLLPRLDAAIARARARHVAGEGPFDYGRLGRWWIRQMQPSSRRRFKVPRAFEPSSSTLDRDAVLAAFLKLQDDLAARAAAADGLDLRRVKASSAAFPLLRLPLGAWLESTVAHEQRHLGQARRVKARADFPHAEH